MFGERGRETSAAPAQMKGKDGADESLYYNRVGSIVGHRLGLVRSAAELCTAAATHASCGAAASGV